jgi:DNA-binding IclR family transcriptional regulator
VGKAMIAYLPESELADVISQQSFFKHTDTTLDSEEKLRAELETIRQTGVSLDMQEHEEGIQCAASMIFNYRNEPIAALSITAPVFRVDDERFEFFQKRIKEACQEVSKRMGAMASA